MNLCFYRPQVQSVSLSMQKRRFMSEPTRSEDQWEYNLALVAKGDKQAFAQLFEHFAPLLKGFLVGGSHPPITSEQAEELVQEVMIKVWQKASSFDIKRAKASTWIYTIARNVRIDLVYRKQNESMDTLDADDIWNSIESDETPLDELSLAREQHQLYDSIKQLPEEQQLVINKIFIESKSHATVAEELELPLGTVKSRARLAMKKLKILVVN